MPDQTAEALTDITAEDLAIARQTLAHSGTGYIPPWHGLNDHERQTATLEAGHWLTALQNILRATAPVPGSSQRAQEPGLADLRRYTAELDGRSAHLDSQRRNALVFNAISEALKQRGQWIPLSDRMACTEAALAALGPMRGPVDGTPRETAASAMRVLPYVHECLGGGPGCACGAV